MTRSPCSRSRLVVPILAGVAMLGCSSTMKLRYEPPPSAAGSSSELAVVLVDGRSPDRGGADPLRVGTIRNAFGMPFPLKASESREPSKVVETLLAECLAASGYRVVEARPGVARLRATLLTFWTAAPTSITEPRTLEPASTDASVACQLRRDPQSNTARRYLSGVPRSCHFREVSRAAIEPPAASNGS